jgi:amidase
MKGTQSGGAAFDSAGPIAKSVEDCADVMNVLLPGRDFGSHLTKSWNGIRIAYLDYKTWQFPDSVCEKTPAFDTQHVSIRSLSKHSDLQSIGDRNAGGSQESRISWIAGHLQRPPHEPS